MTNAELNPAAIHVWNAALPEFPMNERFFRYNTLPAPGEVQQGRAILRGGEMLGFALAACQPGSSLGWVSALAVHPRYQHQGLGSSLLAWAENWLKAQNVRRIRLGASLKPFAPGLPLPLVPAPQPEAEPHAAFFLQRGYLIPRQQPYEYDTARDLQNYRRQTAELESVAVLPLSPQLAPSLDDFLLREYSGRWHAEYQQFLAENGNFSDYLVLLVAGQLQGFCRTTYETSERPLERFYPQRLPRPWGQMGPLGVSKAVRGKGLGALLIDSAAAHLAAQGIRGCVIDWTTLTALYARFGFQPYHRYLTLTKEI